MRYITGPGEAEASKVNKKALTAEHAKKGREGRKRVAGSPWRCKAHNSGAVLSQAGVWRSGGFFDSKT